MNLRDKLRAVDGGGAKKPAQPTERQETDCRHFAVYRPAEEFPGAWDLTRDTLALMSEKEMPEAFDPRRILYLDTETTGLGGSGTVAFLVGMGFLTDRGFEVHQFLMRDYPEEPYLLKHVANGLGKFDVLCTFNGTTFDVPLLESRFLMNRMDRACLDLPHLDLLHLCRRLWKLRLGRCNLGRLEEVVLGKPRQDDLPGSEVPQRYFTYLKTKQMSLLDDILRHNAQDIASLCVLLNHMADLYLHPEKIRFSEDVYSMGRALERINRTENARCCYRLARKGRMGDSAGAALAMSYRRSGDREEAAKIWREMIHEHRGGITPYVELAKYEEHIRKDPSAALKLTEQALALLSEPALRESRTVQEEKNELQYRRQRLTRKLKEQRTDGIYDGNQGQ
ncbi:MAG: ribonuclease H-like domain-containing protein [Clostridia bacterium]|nr:ribonuclease H-like domain-containing protein [Clostridia bacterium]